jgi:hypothetical protein
MIVCGEGTKRTAIVHDIKTYPGSWNTNILKLVKVRLGKGGSFNELEVEAGYACFLCHDDDRSQWLSEAMR